MKSLNFSSVPKREVLPEGIYNFTIEKCEEKTFQSGNEGYLVRFKEVETETVIFENFVVVPEALFKLQEFLGALGYDTESDLDFDCTEIEGNMIKCKVIQDTYNGDIVNRMKKFYAA